MGRFGTGRGTIGEVRNGSGEPLKVRYESGDLRVGPGRVKNTRRGPKRVERPLGRYGTYRWTLVEVRDRSGELR